MKAISTTEHVRIPLSGVTGRANREADSTMTKTGTVNDDDDDNDVRSGLRKCGHGTISDDTKPPWPTFSVLKLLKFHPNSPFYARYRETDTMGVSSYSKCRMYSNINWTSVHPSKDYHPPNSTANQQSSIIGKYSSEPKILFFILCHFHISVSFQSHALFRAPSKWSCGFRRSDGLNLRSVVNHGFVRFELATESSFKNATLGFPYGHWSRIKRTYGHSKTTHAVYDEWDRWMVAEKKALWTLIPSNPLFRVLIAQVHSSRAVCRSI